MNAKGFLRGVPFVGSGAVTAIESRGPQQCGGKRKPRLLPTRSSASSRGALPPRGDFQIIGIVDVFHAANPVRMKKSQESCQPFALVPVAQASSSPDERSNHASPKQKSCSRQRSSAKSARRHRPEGARRPTLAIACRAVYRFTSIHLKSPRKFEKGVCSGGGVYRRPVITNRNCLSRPLLSGERRPASD